MTSREVTRSPTLKRVPLLGGRMRAWMWRPRQALCRAVYGMLATVHSSITMSLTPPTRYDIRFLYQCLRNSAIATCCDVNKPKQNQYIIFECFWLRRWNKMFFTVVFSQEWTLQRWGDTRVDNPPMYCCSQFVMWSNVSYVRTIGPDFKTPSQFSSLRTQPLKLNYWEFSMICLEVDIHI